MVFDNWWAVHLLKLMEYIAYSMIRSTVASMHPHGNLQKKRTIFMCACHNIETKQFDIDLGCMACFIIEISAGENNVIVQDPLFPVNCQKSSLISSSPFKVS